MGAGLQPASELPWAAVPGPTSPTGGSRPAPQASDSIWPATGPEPVDAAAQSWEELAASTRSGGPGDDLAALGEAAGRVPGSEEPAGGSGPFPGSSPWRPASPPRSPSGSSWEVLGDDEPGGSDDAYRSPPGEQVWHAAPVAAPWSDTEAGTHWQPTDGAGRWSPPADPWQPRDAPASSAPWDRPSAAGTWEPQEGAWEPPEAADPATAPGEMFAWRPPENTGEES